MKLCEYCAKIWQSPNDFVYLCLGHRRDFYKPDEPEYVDIDDDEIDILGEIQAEIHFAEEIVNEMASEAEEAELDVTLDTDSDFEPSSCESEEEVEDDAEAEEVNEDEDNEEETEKSTRNSMEEGKGGIYKSIAFADET